METKKRTIGLLVSGIMDQFTESLCRGAMQGCEEADINLVVFPGKYLDRDLSGQPEIMYEYQFNTIFEYAKSHELDGLIVSAGNIGCFSGDARVQKMLAEYDIPYILVASKWDGYVSVNYDNKSGVREGLEYLIDKQGCTKFAMLGGPEGNMDARERRDVFVEGLKEGGLPIEDHQIEYGDLERNNPDQCNKLLDDNPDVEVIFCVNDDTAMGLYEVMKQRGLIPGKNIKVFGYDNTIEGAKATPSLSTVGSDAMFLGQKSVETLLRVLDGEKLEPIVLPAKFIKRDSIGDVGFQDDESLNADVNADDLFDKIFYRYNDDEVGDGSKLRRIFSDFVKLVVHIESKDEVSDEDVFRLMNFIDRLLNNNALEYADMDDMISSIENTCHKLYAKHASTESHYRVRSIVDEVYRKLLQNMDQRAGTAFRERINDIYAMKLFVKDSLQFRKGNDGAYATLIESLHWLKVHNAYIYMFEEPVPHLWQERFSAPKKVYMKACMKNDTITQIPPKKQKLKTESIFANEYVSEDRSNLVIFPLFYNEIQYGLMLCELVEEMFASGEFLMNQTGSATRMIHLLKENEIIQEKLEETLTSLRENNIALDNLSKQDALTGINNRRGYMEAAKTLIEKNHEDDIETLVAYVDMNNLKIINDRYGHEDGDFSLKMISDVLKEVIGDEGVIGRIGGDEYSFALSMRESMTAEAVERRIHSLFNSKNKASDKPYNVTVSIGMYMIESSQVIELEDALSYADEKLYIAKQNKVRVVEKIKEN